MDHDREVVFLAGAGDRQRGFPGRPRDAASGDTRPTERTVDRCYCPCSLPLLRLLPGGGLPRDAAIGARAPMGRGRRDPRRQSSLYLWSAALESLYPRERSDVRRHLCHRPFFRNPLPQVGQPVDRGGDSRDRERLHRYQSRVGAVKRPMKYMVLETFRPGCKAAVYERFREKGRMLPDGLRYIESWVEQDGDRWFQLMERSRFLRDYRAGESGQLAGRFGQGCLIQRASC